VGGFGSGYLVKLAEELLAGACALRDRRIKRGGVAFWWGLIELRAQREAVVRMRAKRDQHQRPPLPEITIERVAKLLDVDLKRAKLDLLELEKAGVIAGPDLEFAGVDACVPTEQREEFARLVQKVVQGRNGSKVPVPRALLSFLARRPKRSVALALIGLVLRTCWVQREGLQTRGTIRSSWVREVLGISRRSWFYAARLLQDAGVLKRERIHSRGKRYALGVIAELAQPSPCVRKKIALNAAETAPNAAKIARFLEELEESPTEILLEEPEARAARSLAGVEGAEEQNTARAERESSTETLGKADPEKRSAGTAATSAHVLPSSGCIAHAERQRALRPAAESTATEPLRTKPMQPWEMIAARIPTRPSPPNASIHELEEGTAQASVQRGPIRGSGRPLAADRDTRTARAARADALGPPTLRNVLPQDLIEPKRRKALYREAVKENLARRSEGGWREFLRQVAHALRVKGNHCAVLITNLKERRMFISGEDEKLASQFLREHEGWLSPAPSRPQEAEPRGGAKVGDVLSGLLDELGLGARAPSRGAQT